MALHDQDRLAWRRREILAAAMKVFDARGYAETTVESVAAEAGVSKGTMYNYFQSKRDLFMQVFAEAVAAGEQRTEQLLGETISATDKIRRVLADWHAELEHYKRIGRLVLEFWVTAAREGREGELTGWFRRKYAGWREKIAAIVKQGVRDGEFRIFDAAAAASLIVAVIDGITVEAILNFGLNVDEEFLASLERAIVTALKAGPASGEAQGLGRSDEA